jgi:hypothetical protein
MDLEFIFSNEKSGECRLSDLSRTIFRPVSIILLQSWPKSIKTQSIPKDTVRLRVQYLLFTGYSSTSVVERTCISIHQRASDTDEVSYGAVSGEKHGRTL